MKNTANTMTQRMIGALHLVVSAGSANIEASPRHGYSNGVANRTAWALEKRGLVSRVYTGRRHEHQIVPTAKGRETADALLGPDGGV